MPVKAGQFSLHHTHLVHNSRPNRSHDRRIGLGISYIPTSARCTVAARGVSAMLVRGEDRLRPFRRRAPAGARRRGPTNARSTPRPSTLPEDECRADRRTTRLPVVGVEKCTTMLRLPYHDRYTYSPITERKDYSWPERQAAGGLSRAQHRALRLRRGRGASAHRRQSAARSAHLRLARLRQPGRRVALPGTVRRAQPAGRAPDQHHGVRLCAADRRCAEGARRRVHRPWPHQCRAPRRHVGGRREALPRGDQRFDREGLGQAAARLDGAVDGLDPRHARSPQGDGLRLPDGLAQRRPAALDEDALGPADERALSDRDQRQPADAGAPPHAARSSATSSSASSRSCCASRPSSRWSAASRSTP